MTLSLQHLCCYTDQKTLVHDICQEFTPGHLYGLIGPNGAGKTTLLKAIAGIYPHLSGSISWQNKPLLDLTPRQLCQFVSYVPCQGNLNFEFTAREIISMGQYSQYRHYYLVQNAVDQALAAVDLARHGERLVTSLSSGERQRVYIARALVSQAPIILLDEPTNSLDIRHQLEIWQLLRKLAQNQRLLIVAHHDLNAATTYCDKLLVLNKGRCVAFGDSSTTLTTTLTATVFGITLHPLQIV